MRHILAAAAAIVSFAAATPVGAVLPVGAKAPDFTTRGAVAGKVVNVNLARQLKKGPVVLYFFPAAFTAGCSAEARAFAENIAAFRAVGATVIGMSADTVEDLTKFSAAECAGKFPVASAGPRVVAEYDVALGRQIKGRDATRRTSYVIDRSGRIAYVHDDLSADRHVALTLEAVRRLPRT